MKVQRNSEKSGKTNTITPYNINPNQSNIGPLKPNSTETLHYSLFRLSSFKIFKYILYYISLWTITPSCLNGIPSFSVFFFCVCVCTTKAFVLHFLNYILSHVLMSKQTPPPLFLFLWSLKLKSSSLPFPSSFLCFQ